MADREKRLTDVPDDELAVFGRVLESSPGLIGRVPVLVGASHLADVGPTPRIVVYPDDGAYQFPGDKAASIADVMQTCIAAIWGTSDAELRYLRVLFFRALEFQQTAKDDLGNDVSLYWNHQRDKWQSTADTTLSGAGLEIYFQLLLSLDRAPGRIGLVSTTNLQKRA